MLIGAAGNRFPGSIFTDALRAKRCGRT